MTGAYYNEHDRFAAAWLRELIREGLIADGEVDERSIVDVRPADLAAFGQCHFFAGIGGWSYAMRLAGWPDERAVWTGSCPCQPFSSAGSQLGGDDPRHLWPAWFCLIRECRPPVVFGEQVEAAVAHGWLDLVCDDLEREGYAVGACSLPAACVGAPHVRQRVWFVADTARGRLRIDGCPPWHGGHDDERGAAGSVADAEHAERRPVDQRGEDGRHWKNNGRQEAHGEPRACGEVYGMGDASGARLQERERDGRLQREAVDAPEGQAAQRGSNDGELGDASGSGLAEQRRHESGSRSHWSEFVWLPCRDGKTRPTQSGLQPLAYGVPNRVGQLRGAGNAIVPTLAAAFISAYVDSSTPTS